MTGYIEYIERTRAFYEAQGFDRPYEWAHYDDIPFHSPTRAVSESRVAIITTAIHPEDEATPMIGRKPRAISLEKVPEHFHTDDLSWDKVTTHTEDRRSYFPLETLQLLAEGGMIGEVSPRYYFVPTEHSKRNTIEADAPATLSACLADEVDIAILIPL